MGRSNSTGQTSVALRWLEPVPGFLVWTWGAGPERTWLLWGPIRPAGPPAQAVLLRGSGSIYRDTALFMWRRQSEAPCLRPRFKPRPLSSVTLRAPIRQHRASQPELKKPPQCFQREEHLMNLPVPVPPPSPSWRFSVHRFQFWHLEPVQTLMFSVVQDKRRTLTAEPIKTRRSTDLAVPFQTRSTCRIAVVGRVVCRLLPPSGLEGQNLPATPCLSTVRQTLSCPCRLVTCPPCPVRTDKVPFWRHVLTSEVCVTLVKGAGQTKPSVRKLDLFT